MYKRVNTGKTQLFTITKECLHTHCAARRQLVIHSNGKTTRQHHGSKYNRSEIVSILHLMNTS